MRATDIIRDVLDIVDKVDGNTSSEINYDTDNEQYSISSDDPDSEAQTDDHSEYGNRPNETTTDVDSVTDQAGGGYNGPKHPDDIRVKDPRIRG